MSRKSSKFKRIDISEKDLEDLVERIRNGELEADDPGTVLDMGKTLLMLSRAYENKSQSLSNILKSMFAPQTEKGAEILKHDLDQNEGEGDDGDDPNKIVDSGDDSYAKPSPKKGTGRNPASAYKGAEKICICHDHLKNGDLCPKCSRGKVYENTPKTIVRVSGNAPISAKVYELQKLRCNTCGAIFTADLHMTSEKKSTIPNRRR